MPRYVYRCSECEELSTIAHLSNETATDCPRCEAPRGLVKVLTNFTTGNKKTRKPKVGDITEEFIQDAFADLEQQKEDLEHNR